MPRLLLVNVESKSTGHSAVHVIDSQGATNQQSAGLLLRVKYLINSLE
jgi:hypothetical protein